MRNVARNIETLAARAADWQRLAGQRAARLGSAHPLTQAAEARHERACRAYLRITGRAPGAVLSGHPACTASPS